MSKALRISLFSSIWIVSSGFNVWAEDSLTALMQRMKSDTAVKIAYQEIRTLELMDQPWTGSGYMYALAPDLMIREQLKPQRLLMGVKGDRLFYFDPENGMHHQMEMDISNPLSMNIAMFKALINADQAMLTRLYSIQFENKSQRWLMTLKSRQNPEQGLTIMVSGLPGQQADTIVTQQPDGDLSEFLMAKKADGEEVNMTVQRLYQEMVGE